jgi:hypothetical protein
MKIKSILIAATAGGVGYVLGTRAGRARFEQLRARAGEFASSPQVKETVTHLAEEVKKNADRLPDPLANVVTSVADSAIHKQQ